MAKTINFVDEQCIDNNESCIIDALSIDNSSVNNWLDDQTSINDPELIAKALEFINKMSELKNTRVSIQNVKYSKDNILCRIIELSEPPFYIKKELMNYKALNLYFMRNFRDKIVLPINQFSDSSSMDTENLKIEVFNNQNSISIKTEMNALLHLINVDKEKIKAKDIYEKIIYDTVEFGEYIRNEKFFHSKVAAVGWIKNTLRDPDIIYSGSSIIAKKLKFDVCFIREAGAGTKKQKYMYHLVGLKRIRDNLYTIVSQFPLEKDRKYSNGADKISQLHELIQCNKPIYIKSGIDIPNYSEELNTEDSPEINRLKNGFGSSF